MQQRVVKSRLKTPEMVRSIGLPRFLVQGWWNQKKYLEKEAWRLEKEIEKEKKKK